MTDSDAPGGDPMARPFEVPDGTGTRVAVIGAGAVGLTAASDLARAGASVTVFERGADPGAGSSGRAAGILYDAYAEDVDVRMAARAMARFRAFASEGGEFGVEPCPYVALARADDESTGEAIAEAAERMRVHGRDVTTTDGEGLHDRFGASLATDDVGTAVVAEDAAWTDTAAYVRDAAERARDAGVEVRTGVEVDVRADPPRVVGDGASEAFDAVLVAAGARTKALLAEAGVEIAMKPYRVQALVSRRPYDGPICYDATARAYFRPHPSGLLAGDGTEPVEADPESWSRAGDEWFVSEVSEVLRSRAGHDPTVERAWGGLCTATPDRKPLLGEIREGVFVATGWHGHGFMWAPASGEAVAAAMLGAPAASIEPYDPRRFRGDEAFEVVEGMAVE
ncbi:NAD(P)/FAD-dependent oxidoreductase [Halopelagius fulvigenes]|uniref:NAD(P)/FAD-dependent oxidoreductase n=1 Tax=Halopelagius fulvigenes TaxID=1198324 RepID=A0ABD5U0H1_9EURY